MTPTYEIIYEGRNVTRDFATYLESVSFKEYLENKASELELTFTNAEQYFLNDWYPGINDKLTAKIGYKESTVINCGVFFVDDVTLSGGRYGDVCSFRATSAYGKSIHSDEQRKNQESKPISTLINTEASRLGYTVKGDLSGTWSGIQKGTGLQFIQQIARETGRIMKVEGTELVFIKRDVVKTGPVIGTINKIDIISYNTTDKATGRITKCTVKCWDKKNKQLITGDYDANIKGGGSRTIWDNVNDVAAAKERAKNYVEDWNKDGEKVEITIPGEPKYRAGVRVSLTGFGRYSKTYYVAEATHATSKNSGYTTKLTLQL